MPERTPVLLALADGPKEPSFVGLYSVIRLTKEQAGYAFFNKYEVPRLTDRSTSTTTAAAAPPGPTIHPDTTTASNNSQRKKKTFKEHSSINSRVKKAIEEELDLYKLLCSKDTDSTEDIKKTYRALALIFHPDKHSLKSESQQLVKNCPDVSKMNTEEMHQHFLAIQNAFEILSDEALRKQYDSNLEFDDALPTAKEIGDATDFYTLCGRAFEKEAKWSSKKPVPLLGDADTPLEDVQKFYKFWTEFDSWRDFSHAGEYDVDDAQDREEKRWIQRENWKVVSKLVKQERVRLMKFVVAAEERDPRIIAARESDRRKKEEAKQQKQRAAKQAKEAREAAEAERRRVLEERRKKLEAERLEEQAKREAERKRVSDLRRRVRQPYTKWCADTGQICEFTSDDLSQFLAAASTEILTSTVDALEQIVGNSSSESQVAADVGAKVAKCIRERMSAWNASRYKATPASIPSPQKQPATPKLKEEWTADDLSVLTKGLVHFPGGTQDRWTKVADLFGGRFTAEQVIAQAKLLRSAQTMKSGDVARELNEKAFSNARKAIPEEKTVIKTAPDVRDESTRVDWTPEQQTALEQGLAKYPGTLPATERWTNIAKMVDGKTPKECLARFKDIRQAILATKQVTERMSR